MAQKLKGQKKKWLPLAYLILQAWFEAGNTICDWKSYLIDTREPHFVENWDEQIAHNDEWQGPT